MNFILPKIHNFIDKSKNCENDSPKKFIHVIDGYAIVSNSIIVAVDLREYIKSEIDIDTDQEFEELTELINWFNGKSFSFEFWNEFIKQSIVSLRTNDVLEIELNSYSKQMIWEDPYVSNAKLKSSLKLIIDNIARDGESIDRIGINSAYYSLLSSAFQKEMKSDSLIFQFAPSGNAMKFTFYRRDYIFGIIPIDQSASMSITAFVNDSLFKDKIENVYESIEVEEFNEIPKIQEELQEDDEENLFSNNQEENSDLEKETKETEINEIPKPPKKKSSKKTSKIEEEPEPIEEENPFMMGDSGPDLS